MPLAIDVLAAVIAIDCNVAAVTVNGMLLDVIPFWEALMLADPTPCPVANPDAFTLATLVFDETHVTELLMFCELPSVNVPVAVNWAVVPFAIEPLAALMVIERSTAVVMVRTIEFEVTPFCEALIVLVPAARPVASPAALIVAIELFDEFHVTEFVSSCVLPSLKMPVAVNWAVVPLATDVLPALIVIDCRLGPAGLEALKLIALCEAPLSVTV